MSDRMVPVQIGPSGKVVAYIPWSVAEKTYEEYARRYGRDQTLERLYERGGFYLSELDDMNPDWRAQAAGRTK